MSAGYIYVGLFLLTVYHTIPKVLPRDFEGQERLYGAVIGVLAFCDVSDASFHVDASRL